MSYTCPPQENQPWRLEGDQCVFDGHEFRADAGQTVRRNCGDWYDYRDAFRCVPKNVRHPATWTGAKGCGNSVVHLKPELLRVATGQTIRIGQDLQIDPTAELAPGKTDRGWTASSWFINGVRLSGTPPDISFTQATPGTYTVRLALSHNLRACQLEDTVQIEVFDNTPPPPPPGCPPGLHKDDTGTCVANTCPEGQRLDESGTCVDLPPKACDGGYHLDPETNTCVANPPINCPAGFQLNEAGTSCEAIVCESGFTLNSDKSACVPLAIPGTSTVCPAGTYNSNGVCITIGGGSYNDITSSGYDRLSSNYQTASSFTDVFSTSETDTKTDTSKMSMTSMLLIGGVALVGIGGIYYMSTVNGRRRNYR